MSRDFRTDRVRTTQIIAENAGPAQKAQIIVYPSQSATNYTSGFTPSLVTAVGTDAFLFVSGTIFSRGVGNSYGTSLFGGDLVASGTILAERGLSGSLTRLADGTSYLVAGSSITINSSSNGQVVISSLAGDVSGPALSTDNAIARFDLTTGKLIQNSAITISDASGGGVTMDTGLSETTVNLFTTNATSVVIGKPGGSTVTTSGNIKVGSNTIQAADGTTALTLTSVSGDVTVAGDLTVTGNDIKASDGNTNITLASNTLTTFAGDIKVSGNDIQASDGNVNITMTSNTLTEVKGDLQVTGNDIKASDGNTNITLTGNTLTAVAGDLKVGGNDIQASDGNTNITLTSNTLTTFAGDIKVTGNDIQASDGNVNITLTSNSLTTVSGDLKVGGNDIQASDGSVSITLAGSDVTVAGDLKVSGNDIKSSTGATAITLSGGNVIIPGDLTVQGTTVTVDATTLTIEDPVIGLGFTSGSTAVGPGDRGFIGGLSGDALGNSALFWDSSDSTFVSARTSNNADAGTSVAITSYTPFRASSFEIGGTPGSAVAAGSAYISSSDAVNIQFNHTLSSSFTKSGVPIVSITDYEGSGEGMITGNAAGGVISSLWLSGSIVNIGGDAVTFFVQNNQEAAITPQPGGGGVKFEAKNGTDQSRVMVISGSQMTIGANNGLIALQRAGVTFMTASSNSGFDTVSLIPGDGYTTANLFNSIATTVNIAGDASVATNIGNATGLTTLAGPTKFTSGLSGSLTQLPDGTSYLIAGSNVTITSASNGPVTISSVGFSSSYASGLFGDGMDGNVTIAAGTTTLTREMYYNNLTVQGTLKPAGYRIFVKGTLTIDVGGSINDDGNSGTGGTGGASLTVRATLGAGAGAGGNGSIGGNGSSGGTSGGSSSPNGSNLAPQGGAGGGAGANTGGTAGAATAPIQGQRWHGTAWQQQGRFNNGVSQALFNGGSGGGGGASSAATATGGGGGGGAGSVWIAARNIVNNGSISANGGSGANGTGTAGAAGGGGGGGGGNVCIGTLTNTGLGTTTVTGGTGGAPYNTGAAGSNGRDGSIIIVVLT